MGLTAILIGCVAGKRNEPCEARDLYTSDLFRKRRVYAEQSGIDWLIVSAKYGILQPDIWTHPYDVALTDLTKPEREAWAELVCGQLTLIYGRLARQTFELHAGGLYRRELERAFTERDASLVYPLAGLGIGKQKRWYLDRVG